MYKVLLLLKRVPDISPAQWTQRWLGQPWANLEAPGLLRHLHNRVIPDAMPIENAPAAAFDAVDEFWFTDASAATNLFGSPSFRAFWQAGGAGLLSGPPLSLSGTSHLLWERDVAKPTDPVKIITLPVRRDGMTPEAFAHHWIHVHSMLALAGPTTKQHLVRLEPCPSDDAGVTGFPPAPYDGAGTIEFADRKDLQAEFASDYYRDVMAPDEPRFTNPLRSGALMVEPFPIETGH